MFALYKRGEITKTQLDEFTQGVNYRALPERVRKVVNRAKKRRKNVKSASGV